MSGTQANHTERTHESLTQSSPSQGGHSYCNFMKELGLSIRNDTCAGAGRTFLKLCVQYHRVGRGPAYFTVEFSGQSAQFLQEVHQQPNVLCANRPCQDESKGYQIYKQIMA